MHSRFDDEQTEKFFERLNKPLKRMPQNVRAELHTELRQHLDALTAANEELGSVPDEAFDLALRQFGDPAKIGRKLWWDWFLGSWKRPSEDFHAVLYALLMYAVSAVALPGLLLAVFFSILLARNGMDDATAEVYGRFATVFLTVGIPACAGLLTGRRFPRQAVPAMFWAAMAPCLLALFGAGVGGLLLRQSLSLALPETFLWLIVCGCLAAYPSSVRKSGKSRLSLADFKIRR